MNLEKTKGTDEHEWRRMHTAKQGRVNMNICFFIILMIDDNQICQKDFEDVKHIFATAGLISTTGKLTCITLKIHLRYSLAKAIVINIALCLNQVKEPALSGLCCVLVQANFIVIKPCSGFSQWEKKKVCVYGDSVWPIRIIC